MHTITLIHQTEQTTHTFTVADPAKLTGSEVATICAEMNVSAVFINGKFYQN